MSGPSAVHWLDTTFKSRERTAELLRPDLESGLITQNDYHTAVAFLPGPHRYYPVSAWPILPLSFSRLRGLKVFYSATSTAVFFAVGRARRWQLTSPRNFAFGFLSNFVGLIWGQFERAKVHYRFARQLENPTGFSQALQNVNVRTGGKEPLRWALPGADTELLKKGLAGSGSVAEEGQSREEDWVREPQITSDVPQADYSSSSKSTHVTIHESPDCLTDGLYVCIQIRRTYLRKTRQLRYPHRLHEVKLNGMKSGTRVQGHKVRLGTLSVNSMNERRYSKDSNGSSEAQTRHLLVPLVLTICSPLLLLRDIMMMIVRRSRHALTRCWRRNGECQKSERR